MLFHPTTVDSWLKSPSALFLNPSIFLFLSLAQPHFSIEGGRACASQQAAEKERKEDRERWGDTEIQLGEGLCETGTGLV